MQDMRELLDIREAAELLRVSETSLRRWTNAGRLPCLRIGGKRERRFRRSDLLAFAGAHSAATPAQGTRHYCTLYTSDLIRVQQAAAFVAGGLAANAICVLIASHDVQHSIMDLVGRRRSTVGNDVKAGRLILSQYHDSVTAQLRFWNNCLDAAAQSSVAPLRVVGDVSGGALGGLPFAEILEYEVEYGRAVAGRFPVITLCQYDARALSGLQAAELLGCHDGAESYRSQH